MVLKVYGSNGLHMVRIVRGKNSQWYEKSSNLSHLTVRWQESGKTGAAAAAESREETARWVGTAVYTEAQLSRPATRPTPSGLFMR